MTTPPRDPNANAPTRVQLCLTRRFPNDGCKKPLGHSGLHDWQCEHEWPLNESITKPGVDPQYCCNSASAQSDRAEQLAQPLAKLLHRWMSAAQNLEWEDGDICDDCLSDIRAEFLPLLRTALDDAVREAQSKLKQLETLYANLVTTLPATYYSDRETSWRLHRLIDDWRKAVTVNSKLESKLAPNPDCPRGHRMADWVDDKSCCDGLGRHSIMCGSYGTLKKSFCRACRFEDEVGQRGYQRGVGEGK